MTQAQRKALKIIREHGPIAPREFAEQMWPDSPGWKRVHNCGPNGAHAGGGMYLAGGSYLGRLRKEGLVTHHFEESRRYWRTRYVLTEQGRRLLEVDRGV